MVIREPRMRIQDHHANSNFQDAIRELMIMDMLRAHPHVIHLLGTTWPDGMLCIITHWMENGTIGHFLNRNSPGLTVLPKSVFLLYILCDLYELYSMQYASLYKVGNIEILRQVRMSRARRSYKKRYSP